jgi:hypothetical protein
MKDLNHPDYVIATDEGQPTLLNFSKWSRENVPKEPPRFKIGDEVVVRLQVCKVTKDCDGTPLFVLCGTGEGNLLLYQEHGIGAIYGYGNESLSPAGLPENELDEIEVAGT